MLKLVKAREVAALQSLLRAHIRQTMHSYLDVLGDRDALGEEAVPIGSGAGPSVPGARRREESSAQSLAQRDLYPPSRRVGEARPRTWLFHPFPLLSTS